MVNSYSAAYDNMFEVSRNGTAKPKTFLFGFFPVYPIT
ncbi:hypothetical protein THTE_3778 [Thermogutta terrifontis]|uniref:Uncharacterized protein n=1 Tax=Thermogutta terrifontis TaxID=1331910 RepID=A0A286RK92_9BACT|nr:hypothetical protein THTE_3778 [Thermogutta terrifontis]